jgi:hypothetical protein
VTAAKILPIYQGMGFTAGDVYQPESTYTRTLPWISFFWYGDANQTFVDLFDAEAMSDIQRRAYEHAVSVRDNPWILGIGGPDLPIWDEKLVRMYRELPPESAGRKRYVEHLRDRYTNDIAKFNQVYGTAFASFDDLATQKKIVYPIDAENDAMDSWILRWRLPVPAKDSKNPAMTEDNDTFSALVATTPPSSSPMLSAAPTSSDSSSASYSVIIATTKTSFRSEPHALTFATTEPLMNIGPTNYGKLTSKLKREF